MNYAGDELDRMSVRAWSAVASDAGRASGQLRRTGIAFVRDHPFLSIAGVAGLGMWLSRAALGPRSTPRAAEGARQSSHRRAHERRSKNSKKKRSSAMSALGGLLQMWALEAVTSMLKPDPEAAAEAPNDTLTRN